MLELEKSTKKVDVLSGGREFNLVKVVERLAKLSGDIEDRPIAEQLSTDFRKIPED